jgi:hypothetical protein
MADHDHDHDEGTGEDLATRVFIVTMIGTVMYVAAAMFILL